MSGSDVDGTTTDAIEKIIDPDAGTWSVARSFRLPLYPHLFLTAGGRLVYTGGKMDTDGDSDPLLFDPLQPSQATLITGLDDRGRCNQSASVVLPPAQAQRFMILGGGPQDEDGQPRQPATTRVAVVDLTEAVPTFRAVAPLNRERMHVNAVLLPDRTVLATGGGVTREASTGGVIDPEAFNEVFEAETYNPATNEWTLTAPATVARLYHSVALLLPDGRVVTAGGNPDKGRSITWLPPQDPMEEMRLEIYSPPYLFRTDAGRPRPTITTASTEVTYGTPFTVTSTHTGALPQLCLIRPGLTTHSFNGEQRLVEVNVHDTPPGRLVAHVATDARIAVPGWYLLFLTDDRGVPSEGGWVHLS